MVVRVVRQDGTEQCRDSDYVRVSASADPNDDTVTLATIERVVEKKPSSYVKTLVLERPMSIVEAVGLATCYAKRKKIPVVYTNV